MYKLIKKKKSLLKNTEVIYYETFAIATNYKKALDELQKYPELYITEYNPCIKKNIGLLKAPHA